MNDKSGVQTVILLLFFIHGS